jgi:hypothetical protein
MERNLKFLYKNNYDQLCLGSVMEELATDPQFLRLTQAVHVMPIVCRCTLIFILVLFPYHRWLAVTSNRCRDGGFAIRVQFVSIARDALFVISSGSHA